MTKEIKVAVFGCGGVGQCIAQDLVKSKHVTNMVLADVNLKGPESVRKRTKSDKIESVKADGTKPEEVAKVAEKVDLLINSDDMADACLYLMNLPEEMFSSLLTPHASPLVNIGCGKDQTIREVAELVKEVVEFAGDIVFYKSKPDGAPRKLLDINRLETLGWRPSMDFKEGLGQSYRDFLAGVM